MTTKYHNYNGFHLFLVGVATTLTGWFIGWSSYDAIGFNDTGGTDLQAGITSRLDEPVDVVREDDGEITVICEFRIVHEEVCGQLGATECPAPTPTYVRTPGPSPTSTPEDTPEPTPTIPGPTDTPAPTPTTPITPEPTETPRPSCNRGVGNYEEDCDPGNSSGQGQGDGRPAGEDKHEDDGPPGKGGDGKGSAGAWARTYARW